MMCVIANSNSCGGNMAGSTGTFQSPGYPTNYDNSEDCDWHILVQSGYRVSISFSDFDLEGGIGCPYDWVEIFDDSNSAVSLGK